MPLRVELSLSGRLGGFVLGREFRDAVSELLGAAGITLSSPNLDDLTSPESLAIYRSRGNLLLVYSNLTPDLDDIPALEKLVGRRLSINGSTLKVVSARGWSLDPRALRSGSEARLRLATPFLLTESNLPAISHILESAASVWKRHVGIGLKVPSKVRVLRAKFRVIRLPGASGLVGWAVLRQDHGSSLGEVVQAASFSGAGLWRAYGFGAIEADVL